MDEYLAGLPDPQREALEYVRAVVRRGRPGRQGGAQLRVPAFRSGGRPLLGFSAHRDHLSLHPFSSEVVAAVADRLAGFDVSKGTIRFTPGRPMPDDVIEAMLELRLA